MQKILPLKTIQIMYKIPLGAILDIVFQYGDDVTNTLDKLERLQNS